MKNAKIINIPYLGGNYNVFVGKNIIKCASDIIGGLGKYDLVFVVSDSNVYPIYGGMIECDGHFVFPAGEKSKNLSTISDMYHAFHNAGLTRSSLLIALGGGVTGDMTGFAASTYMRGIDFVQIPTTLLSQIDSSVGGKTGVDTDFGKNTVGAFYQPRAVFADSAVLDSLPRDYYIDGLGEAVKYGCISDAPLFASFESGYPDIAVLIERCIKAKAKVVTEDEYDRGLRATLNFGHTIGHAIEKCANYGGLSHGCAVAVGMVYASAVGEIIGITPKGTTKQIKACLNLHGLPTKTEFSAKDLAEGVLSDKKREGGSVSFILLRRIGESVIHKINTNELEGLISSAEEYARA